jgi:hypothetical protein
MKIDPLCAHCGKRLSKREAKDSNLHTNCLAEELEDQAYLAGMTDKKFRSEFFILVDMGETEEIERLDEKYNRFVAERWGQQVTAMDFV